MIVVTPSCGYMQCNAKIDFTKIIVNSFLCETKLMVFARLALHVPRQDKCPKRLMSRIKVSYFVSEPTKLYIDKEYDAKPSSWQPIVFRAIEGLWERR